MSKEEFRASSTEKLLSLGQEVIRKNDIKHLAFIVDGNRRWAQERGLPLIEGYRKALEKILKLVEYGIDLKIPVMSFWLFSTENWTRGDNFASLIFDIGREAFPRVEETLMRLGARFKHIGRKDRLPPDLQMIISYLEEETEQKTNLTVLSAIDYGGRDEIVRAIRKIVGSGQTVETVEEFSLFLDTAGFPDPDLVIRTSGEQRSSGFMIWQAAYSEWHSLPVLFPDLELAGLVATISKFNKI